MVLLLLLFFSLFFCLGLFFFLAGNNFDFFLKNVQNPCFCFLSFFEKGFMHPFFSSWSICPPSECPHTHSVSPASQFPSHQMPAQYYRMCRYSGEILPVAEYSIDQWDCEEGGAQAEGNPSPGCWGGVVSRRLFPPPAQLFPPPGCPLVGGALAATGCAASTRTARRARQRRRRTPSAGRTRTRRR